MAFGNGIEWIFITVAALVGNAAAATYVVGDGLGWRVPTNGPAAYADWASRHAFRVGDVLVFNYPSGFHDVSMVTRPAFDNCNSTNPLLLATIGPTPITLNSTGDHYFICTFDRHCFFGQKLAINVTEPASSAPARAPTSPSPSPTLAPGATPSPSPRSTVTPPSPASAVTPGLPPSPSSSAGNNSIPPSRSTAAMVTMTYPFVMLALMVVGLMI